MTLEQRVKAFVALGKVMQHLGEGKDWESNALGVTAGEYEKLQRVINTQIHHNGWFSKDNVQTSLRNLAGMLQEEALLNWVNQYTFIATNKRIAIIMAGNIPMVGFHDFMCVLLSGNKAVCKLSSEDKFLLPAFCEVLAKFDPAFYKYIEFVQGNLKNPDAVIATGSNNSAQYFKKYFGAYPNIIRKGRTSLAVLDGTETKEELQALGSDIFTHYGLGCRNVTQLLIPKDFDLDRFFGAIVDYGDIINHNKYANNYDYYRAVYLMNQDDLLENGFLLTKEENTLFSPIGVLFYHRYADQQEVEQYLKEQEENIQAIVGKQHLPFGSVQTPGLEDYADGVNTMEFLAGLA